MTVIPGAELRMIIEKVRISLAETTNPDAREKLQWLQGEVEAGLDSLAGRSGQETQL